MPASESDVSAAINDIVADAVEHFDGERFWPAHPLDGAFFGHTGFYYGATGMIWAIDYLGCVGATKIRFNFRSFLRRLMDASRAELSGYQDYAAHGSLLVGDLGTALMVMRLDPDPAIADLVYARANATTPRHFASTVTELPGW